MFRKRTYFGLEGFHFPKTLQEVYEYFGRDHSKFICSLNEITHLIAELIVSLLSQVSFSNNFKLQDSLRQLRTYILPSWDFGLQQLQTLDFKVGKSLYIYW